MPFMKPIRILYESVFIVIILRVYHSNEISLGIVRYTGAID